MTAVKTVSLLESAHPRRHASLDGASPLAGVLPPDALRLRLPGRAGPGRLATRRAAGA